MPAFRPFAPIALALAVAALPLSAMADSFSPAQRGEIESIIKNYLVTHPEVLEEASAELSKRQAVAESEKQRAAVQQYANELFSSPHNVVIGNPDGDVNFVEFFDYNCPYCKHAMVDMLSILKTDPKLRVTLVEFPVLGPASVDAARVAVAVHMQDPTGKKYLDFHQRLLGGRGQADKARALAAAKDAGLDVARIEKDMASAEVQATLEQNLKVAEALGLNGTPSYVIGKDVVVGAVGLNGLTKKISEARCGKETC
ncbi:MAG: DsbA family protein [Xanthobacteraceae bacterium]|nr:DsbA family protein [Xanthobacteraceae bacterium]